MSKVRQYTDTGEVFRIHIDHLTADGQDVYLTQTHGPYATRGAARRQAVIFIKQATVGLHKAVARVEAAATSWQEIDL